tara:strand:- start:22356 stop:23435 length:1080 start_codon:yes stop_codon:yes gene_type:complete
LKIVTIIGARPQFIKAAPLTLAIKRDYHPHIKETIVHTGQHFDKEMSDIFFKELNLPEPHYNLNISSLTHGAMTGRMLEGIEQILVKERPDYVLLYGDTNSTLSGALAAVKLGIKIVHIEAGLRSFNMEMPEEINRILVDRISSLLFCPSKSSVLNLKMEGIVKEVYEVGDIMMDSIELFKKMKMVAKLKHIPSSETEFFLATLHRQENTDNREVLQKILQSLNDFAKKNKLFFPLHPRTKKKIEEFKLEKYLDNMILLKPLSFFEAQQYLSQSNFLITDSGGMQKESFYHGVPCITLRKETEWTETIGEGMNYLLGNSYTDIKKIVNLHDRSKQYDKNIYGDGKTAYKILEILTGNVN